MIVKGHAGRLSRSLSDCRGDGITFGPSRHARTYASCRQTGAGSSDTRATTICWMPVTTVPLWRPPAHF